MIGLRTETDNHSIKYNSSTNSIVPNTLSSNLTKQLSGRFYTSNAMNKPIDKQSNKSSNNIVKSKLSNNINKSNTINHLLNKNEIDLYNETIKYNELQEKLTQIKHMKALKEQRNSERNRRKLIYTSIVKIQRYFKRWSRSRKTHSADLIINFIRIIQMREALSVAAWAAATIKRFAKLACNVWFSRKQRAIVIESLSKSTWTDVSSNAINNVADQIIKDYEEKLKLIELERIKAIPVVISPKFTSLLDSLKIASPMASIASLKVIANKAKHFKKDNPIIKEIVNADNNNINNNNDSNKSTDKANIKPAVENKRIVKPEDNNIVGSFAFAKSKRKNSILDKPAEKFIDLKKDSRLSNNNSKSIRSSDKSIVKVADKPIDKSSERILYRKTIKPVAKQVDKQIDKAIDKLIENQSETVEGKYNNSADKANFKPTHVNSQVVKQIVKPLDKQIVKPMDNTVDNPKTVIIQIDKSKDKLLDKELAIKQAEKSSTEKQLHSKLQSNKPRDSLIINQKIIRKSKANNADFGKSNFPNITVDKMNSIRVDDIFTSNYELNEKSENNIVGKNTTSSSDNGIINEIKLESKINETFDEVLELANNINYDLTNRKPIETNDKIDNNIIDNLNSNGGDITINDKVIEDLNPLTTNSTISNHTKNVIESLIMPEVSTIESKSDLIDNQIDNNIDSTPNNLVHDYVIDDKLFQIHKINSFSETNQIYTSMNNNNDYQIDSQIVIQLSDQVDNQVNGISDDYVKNNLLDTTFNRLNVDSNENNVTNQINNYIDSPLIELIESKLIEYQVFNENQSIDNDVNTDYDIISNDMIDDTIPGPNEILSNNNSRDLDTNHRVDLTIDTIVSVNPSKNNINIANTEIKSSNVQSVSIIGSNADNQGVHNVGSNVSIESTDKPIDEKSINQTTIESIKKPKEDNELNNIINNEITNYYKKIYDEISNIHRNTKSTISYTNSYSSYSESPYSDTNNSSKQNVNEIETDAYDDNYTYLIENDISPRKDSIINSFPIDNAPDSSNDVIIVNKLIHSIDKQSDNSSDDDETVTNTYNNPNKSIIRPDYYIDKHIHLTSNRPTSHINYDIASPGDQSTDSKRIMSLIMKAASTANKILKNKDNDNDRKTRSSRRSSFNPNDTSASSYISKYIIKQIQKDSKLSLQLDGKIDSEFDSKVNAPLVNNKTINLRVSKYLQKLKDKKIMKKQKEDNIDKQKQLVAQSAYDSLKRSVVKSKPIQTSKLSKQKKDINTITDKNSNSNNDISNELSNYLSDHHQNSNYHRHEVHSSGLHLEDHDYTYSDIVNRRQTNSDNNHDQMIDNPFDRLTQRRKSHMAYNLSPREYKTISLKEFVLIDSDRDINTANTNMSNNIRVPSYISNQLMKSTFSNQPTFNRETYSALVSPLVMLQSNNEFDSNDYTTGDENKSDLETSNSQLDFNCYFEDLKYKSIEILNDKIDIPINIKIHKNSNQKSKNRKSKLKKKFLKNINFATKINNQIDSKVDAKVGSLINTKPDNDLEFKVSDDLLAMVNKAKNKLGLSTDSTTIYTNTNTNNSIDIKSNYKADSVTNNKIDSYIPKQVLESQVNKFLSTKIAIPIPPPPSIPSIGISTNIYSNPSKNKSNYVNNLKNTVNVSKQIDIQLKSTNLLVNDNKNDIKNVSNQSPVLTSTNVNDKSNSIVFGTPIDNSKSIIDNELDSNINTIIDHKSFSEPGSRVYSPIDIQLDSIVNHKINSKIDSKLTSIINSAINSTVVSSKNSTVNSTVNSRVNSRINSKRDSQIDHDLNFMEGILNEESNRLKKSIEQRLHISRVLTPQIDTNSSTKITTDTSTDNKKSDFHTSSESIHIYDNDDEDEDEDDESQYDESNKIDINHLKEEDMYEIYTDIDKYMHKYSLTNDKDDVTDSKTIASTIKLTSNEINDKQIDMNNSDDSNKETVVESLSEKLNHITKSLLYQWALEDQNKE